ncbi:hypothetical protein [Sphingomonas sp. MMS24-J13]
MLIMQRGTVAIWDMGGEWYVYNGAKLVRVCPSIGMAREVASGL